MRNTIKLTHDGNTAHEKHFVCLNMHFLFDFKKMPIAFLHNTNESPAYS